MTNSVNIVGAGLAGCEAAWQLAKRGVSVVIWEMKPLKKSPAHHSDGFAELVCSNSLKAEHITNASGLLKAEMRALGSLILSAADASRVPAGTALAVDRDAFSEFITREIRENPLIEVKSAVIGEIPPLPAIIATGPLTDGKLTAAIMRLPGLREMNFFDAAAPIVTEESIDMSVAFRASRYDNGADYINCPMSREEYDAFFDALISAELAEVHDFEKNMVFEGCLAVEILASRGRQTLAFGPMRPVGIIDPRTGKPPYANVQLRQENAQGTLYNMVGFQTRLKWGEQKRVFSMIPGLARAEFVRYGVMHKNTYINGPEALDRNFAWKGDKNLRFAGQLSGVEGYMESAASGMLAAIGLSQSLAGREEIDFTGMTMLGALERYVRTKNADFQPMNANFGLLSAPDKHIRAKKQRYEALAKRSMEIIEGIAGEI